MLAIVVDDVVAPLAQTRARRRNGIVGGAAFLFILALRLGNLQKPARQKLVHARGAYLLLAVLASRNVDGRTPELYHLVLADEDAEVIHAAQAHAHHVAALCRLENPLHAFNFFSI